VLKNPDFEIDHNCEVAEVRREFLAWGFGLQRLLPALDLLSLSLSNVSRGSRNDQGDFQRGQFGGFSTQSAVSGSSVSIGQSAGRGEQQAKWPGTGARRRKQQSRSPFL
jgi:hypothetical protein